MKYVFILGQNPELSVTELVAVIPGLRVVRQTSSFLIGETVERIDAHALMNRLGGTIKIGKIISETKSKQVIIDVLMAVSQEGKLNFGISYYDCPKDNMGMEIKKSLQSSGISCRLVTSKEKELSSVVITKNRCHEFMIFGGTTIAQTLVVQDFEEYSHFDYGRPSRDLVSGSLPPKLAKMMINLAGVPASAVLLDPFCGSGTILSEALMMGYQKIIGTDISQKAIKDSEKNLKWLITETGLDISGVHILQCDVRELNKKIDQVDAIVTEPFLGPPLRGLETADQMKKNIDELGQLYIDAFRQFKLILNPLGKIIIIFPVFRHGHTHVSLPILADIKKLGFTQVDNGKLLYGRAGQKVWRQIHIFQK